MLISKHHLGLIESSEPFARDSNPSYALQKFHFLLSALIVRRAKVLIVGSSYTFLPVFGKDMVLPSCPADWCSL
jgi:hypothetical protein